MKHEIKARFPANSSVVIRAFTDPAFHTAKLEQLGITAYEVLGQRFDGLDFSIRIRRKVPIGVPIPGAIKKFLGGGELTVVHEDCWNLKSKTGRVNMDIQGMPLDLSCELALADEGEGCAYTYLWDVRARIPLVGGLLERTLIADLDNKISAETAAGIALLNNYR